MYAHVLYAQFACLQQVLGKANKSNVIKPKEIHADDDLKTFLRLPRFFRHVLFFVMDLYSN